MVNPHVPVFILISFGHSEKLCSKFCLRLASAMANIINAIFKEMRAMRLSQVLGTSLCRQTFFSITAALRLERGNRCLICVNELKVRGCLFTSTELLPLAIHAEFKVGGGLQRRQRLACDLQLAIHKLLVALAVH